MVPFNDLSRQSVLHGDSYNRIFRDVLGKGWFLNGPNLAAFEKAFAEYNGLYHVAGCSSGTAALEIALRAWQIGPGDEVMVPANTWVSDAEVVVRTGATPVFIDVKSDTGFMDPEDVVAKRNTATKAIVIVHMYGNLAPVKGIRTILGPEVMILEDHAHNTGRPVTSRGPDLMGDAHAFSFYPTKNLGALGDAGALGSMDPDFIEKVRLLRDHGQSRRDDHVLIGSTDRMDEIQAAILGYKLKYLDEWVAKRRSIGERYLEALQDTSKLTPGARYNESSVYHLFVVRADDPDHFIKYLADSGIGFGRHYPQALCDLPPFKKLKQVCKRASERAAHLVSLPLFPELTEEEIIQVCDALRHYA